MLANRSADTGPEIRLRRALHARGLRYRKNTALVLPTRRVRPDVVFPRLRIAVFVDGCFWHGCPVHATTPRANAAYWVPKLAANARRDREVDAALAQHGWKVIRIWEHEDPEQAANVIVAAVRSRL